MFYIYLLITSLANVSLVHWGFKILSLNLKARIFLGILQSGKDSADMIFLNHLTVNISWLVGILDALFFQRCLP